MKWLAGVFFLIASTGEVRVRAESSLFCDETVVQPNKLISGCVWLRSKKKESIETLHATASSPESHFYIEYIGNKINFVNHSSLLTLSLRDGRQVSVPAGFSIWVSEIQENKKNQIGVLQPVDLKTHLARLGSVWEGTSQELKAELQPVVGRWGKTQELAAQYYEGLVSRRIASYEEAQDKKRKQLTNQLTERRRNQKILFERVFSR